ncbi:MAG: hypothetical protein K2N56_05125, partial [Oscillospiraceae bacterium]|nr:hypothetical protein [Oscillospiraceae bacterium]
SDTEVLIHGYEEWGSAMLNRLRCMFAFVIWDEEKEELFAARDFFGIKPLYYTIVGESLVFASGIYFCSANNLTAAILIAAVSPCLFYCLKPQEKKT